MTSQGHILMQNTRLRHWLKVKCKTQNDVIRSNILYKAQDDCIRPNITTKIQEVIIRTNTGKTQGDVIRWSNIIHNINSHLRVSFIKITVYHITNINTTYLAYKFTKYFTLQMSAEIVFHEG